MARPHMSDQPATAHAHQISLGLSPATVRGMNRRRGSQYIMRALRASPGSDLAAVAATIGVSRKSALKALQQPAGRGGCDTALAEAFVGMDAPRAAALTVSRVCPPRLARLAAQTRIGAGRGIVWGAASWSGRSRLHPGAPRCVLIEAAATRGSGPRKDTAAHRSLPPAALVRLAADPEPAVRAAAGTSPAAEVGVLGLLAEDPSDSPCTAAVRNRRCPKWMLAGLAADSLIRLKELKSDLSGDERLRWSAQQRLREIQGAVTRNPSCPSDVKRDIAKHADPGVRATLAAACRDDPQLLELLASCREGVVEQSVAQNPTCPPDLLRELSGRRRRDAKMNSWIIETIAKNPNCPPDLLAGFAQSEHPDWRSAALRNPNCPPETLQSSSRSEDARTLADVATNPSCGPELLQQMVSGADTRAPAIAAASNPNSPPDLLNAIAAGAYERFVVVKLAANPACPPELLDELAACDNPNVRAVVAAHPNCGLSTLAALSTDSDDDTKAAARNALRGLSRQTRGIPGDTDAGTTTSDLES